jgi:hypothetical protein
MSHTYRVDCTRVTPLFEEVGDSSEEGFPSLFINDDRSRSRFYCNRVLKLVSDKISGRGNHDERTTEGCKPG